MFNAFYDVHIKKEYIFFLFAFYINMGCLMVSLYFQNVFLYSKSNLKVYSEYFTQNE